MLNYLSQFIIDLLKSKSIKPQIDILKKLLNWLFSLCLFSISSSLYLLSFHNVKIISNNFTIQFRTSICIERLIKHIFIKIWSELPLALIISQLREWRFKSPSSFSFEFQISKNSKISKYLSPLCSLKAEKCCWFLAVRLKLIVWSRGRNGVFLWKLKAFEGAIFCLDFMRSVNKRGIMFVFKDLLKGRSLVNSRS